MAKTSHEFAERLRDLLKPILSEEGKSQRRLAKTANIPLSAFNRIYKDGIGSEDHICSILQEVLHLKKRRILEILTDRRAELSEGAAKKVWAGFKYAFVDEQEYLSEMCPFPLDRAFACTDMGIPISKLVELAQSKGINNIQDLHDINPFMLFEFAKSAETVFGKEATKAIFSSKPKKSPPVLLFEFIEQRDAREYVKLKNCDGKVFFGLPHLLLADYVFEKDGEVSPHRHTDGVEMLYSIEGTFEITCRKQKCQTLLTPRSSLLIYNAKVNHGIKLEKGNKGRLLIARFCPSKRNVSPGHINRKRHN